MRILVIGEHLAPLITREVLDKLKAETGEDIELRVAESVVSRHHRGEGIPTITIKEEAPYKPERTFDKIDRAEQRRRNKNANRLTKRGRYA